MYQSYQAISLRMLKLGQKYNRTIDHIFFFKKESIFVSVCKNSLSQGYFFKPKTRYIYYDDILLQYKNFNFTRSILSAPQQWALQHRPYVDTASRFRQARKCCGLQDDSHVSASLPRLLLTAAMKFLHLYLYRPPAKKIRAKHREQNEET